MFLKSERETLMKWLIEVFYGSLIPTETMCREILSTKEGVAYARVFLANKENNKFAIYEPLRVYFECC